MKKSLLQDVFERARVNNIRINLFIFIVEIYRDVVRYKFRYDFNYCDNAEENDFYTIADEHQTNDFEVSRIQFLGMISELKKMPSCAFRQLTKLHNFRHHDVVSE